MLRCKILFPRHSRTRHSGRHILLRHSGAHRQVRTRNPFLLPTPRHDGFRARSFHSRPGMTASWKPASYAGLPRVSSLFAEPSSEADGLPGQARQRRTYRATHTSASSRHDMPEFCAIIVPRKSEGAGKAGCANAPAALRVKMENTQVSHHRFTGHSRPSLREWF